MLQHQGVTWWHSNSEDVSCFVKPLKVSKIDKINNARSSFRQPGSTVIKAGPIEVCFLGRMSRTWKEAFLNFRRLTPNQFGIPEAPTSPEKKIIVDHIGRLSRHSVLKLTWRIFWWKLHHIYAYQVLHDEFNLCSPLRCGSS